MKRQATLRKLSGGVVTTALVSTVVALVASSVMAEANSPVGVWETIDDNTHKAKSNVQISERNGKLSGKIIKLIDPDEPNPLCTECQGAKKNQPVIGMVILWNMTKGDDGWWEGGSIMDPDNGKTYRCKIKLTHGGAKLDVRGFVGISLFGRTQTWNRLR